MTDKAAIDLMKLMLAERKEFMNLVKDLTDKVYFAGKPQDLVAKKATEMPVEKRDEEKDEELFIPLESADPNEVAKAMRKQNG